MKLKVFSVVLAAALAVFALSACAGKTDDGSTSVPAASDAASTEESTADVASTGEATSEEATSDEASTETPTTEAPTTEAPTTEAPTTEAPTTEAPTEAPAPTSSVEDIAAAIASRGSFKETMTASSSAIGLQRFGISAGSVNAAAYYAGTGAVAEEILVVNTSSPDAVKNAMYGRQAEQKEDYADYVPTEVPKIENAVVYQSGSIVVYCVSEDASAVRGILSGMIG